MRQRRPRPGFRFSLRALFAVATVLAVAMGWSTNVVQRRSALRQDIESRGGRFDWRSGIVSDEKREAVIARRVEQMTHRAHGSHGVCRSFPATAPFLLNGVRRWLGDRLYWDIVVYDEGDAVAVKREFPEAVVVLVSKP